MTDLKARIGTIERVTPPDLWTAIEGRASAPSTSVPDEFSFGRRASTVRRTVALLVAAALFVAAFLFLQRIYRAEPTVSPATPAPPAAPVAFGAWGPSGILYASDAGGADNIWMIQADGSAGRPLTDNTDDKLAYGSAAWSPDGTRIAFSVYSYRDDLYRLYVMNADGTGLLQVGDGAGAIWAPDGTRVVYLQDSRSDSYKRAIVVSDLHGTVTVVGDTFGPQRGVQGYQPFPVDVPVSWSPTGSAVVVVGDRGDLTVVRLDGSPPSALPTGMTHAGEPAWSPDGATIAFSCWQKDEVDTVCSIPADGGPVKELGGGGYPVWSPDGSSIAFLMDSDMFTYDLHVMTSDGSHDRSLGLVFQWAHSWSPDGTHVLVTDDTGFANNQVDTDLRIVPVDGSPVVKLTTGSNVDHAY